jgi:hypothetical protein
VLYLHAIHTDVALLQISKSNDKIFTKFSMNVMPIERERPIITHIQGLI